MIFLFFFDSVSRRNILNANHNYNFTKSQLRRHKSVMGVRVCILYMISLYLKQFACHLSRDNVVNQQKKKKTTPLGANVIMFVTVLK